MSTLRVVRRRPSGVYRTGPGTFFRVSETVERGLMVEVLKDEVWVRGHISMVGLRLASSTVLLDASQIAALPA